MFDPTPIVELIDQALAELDAVDDGTNPDRVAQARSHLLTGRMAAEYAGTESPYRL